MTDALNAVRFARETWLIKDELDRTARLEAVDRLGSFGLFSLRQIATFTGVRLPTVADRVSKSERTGGTLDPKALEELESLLASKPTPDAVARAVRAGASATMVARLTGLNRTTIVRWAARPEIAARR